MAFFLKQISDFVSSTKSNVLLYSNYSMDKAAVRNHIIILKKVRQQDQ